jgi:A/G-specific adenine glycosylase
MTTSTDLFRDVLLTWGEGRRADLPWRSTRDPWRVLVSETMLQQTGVDRVAPRYEEFIAALPTPTACAQAARGDVIRLWDGLGYYRRAVHLHEAAGMVVRDHDGEVPGDLAALLALPGVGPYTARAVLSLAFGRDVGVLDTNVGRVLARAVVGQQMRPADAQRIADELVPAGRARDWNQAMMDFGATVCQKRRPRCGQCPAQHLCAWVSAGPPYPDPAEGSAGVSTRQAPFVGSDREGRGRLVRALRDGPVEVERLPAVAGWAADPERAHRVTGDLVADGIAVLADGRLELP